MEDGLLKRTRLDYAAPGRRPPAHPAATTSVFIGLFAVVWASLAFAALLLPPSPVSLLLAVGLVPTSGFGIVLACLFARGATRAWALGLNVTAFLGGASLLVMAAIYR